MINNLKKKNWAKFKKKKLVKTYLCMRSFEIMNEQYFKEITNHFHPV